MAGLTKQHFEEIAKILNSSDYSDDVIRKNQSITEVMETERHNTINEISEALADYFISQNPLFNRERFIKACFKK